MPMNLQGLAARMGPGPPPQAGPAPGAGPAPAAPMGGGPMGGGNDPVSMGRQLLQQLTMLITSDPQVMLALKNDLIAFGQILRDFAGSSGGGAPQGGAPMAPGGGMPPGAGGMPPMGA